jgi:type II secretory pathway pseudopilin PulG
MDTSPKTPVVADVSRRHLAARPNTLTDVGGYTLSANRARRGILGPGAFTLLELLVVLGLIALAGFMLAPALARTSPVTKTVQCRNHLKQLTAGWKMYASDNGDRLVASASGITGRPAWVTGFIDYSPGNTANYDITRDITKSPLWAYIGRDATLFRCPADQSYVRVGGVNKARVRSLSMSDVFGQGSWLTPDFWRTYAKGADIMVPARTFLFIDEHPDSINDGSFAVACTGADRASTARIIDYPASWHDNGACGMSFADGRAETHKWLSAQMKPAATYTGGLPLNVEAPGAWVDISWLAQNTTVRR